jgi:hypothetical protein
MSRWTGCGKPSWRRFATSCAVTLVAGVLDFRFRIDAEDGQGVIVYTLPFSTP